MSSLGAIVRQYSDVHRCLVRYMMMKGYTTVSDFLDKVIAFKEVFNEGGDNSDEIEQLKNNRDSIMEPLIKFMNRKLDFSGLRFVEIVDEYDGDASFVALVNSCAFSDVLTSGFKPNEMAFITKLFKSICNDERAELNSCDALNMGYETDVKLSLKRSQEILDKLIASKWLCLDPENRSMLRLTVKGELEWGQYVQSESILHKCSLCQNFILIKSRLLHCTVCNDTFIHQHCAKRMIQKRKLANFKCPGRDGKCGAVLLRRAEIGGGC
ncbi:unnamed protein product [Anisakis simplex]|uniref:Non-structural maintenance of chromosomes element 1 homolog n=1 Tax=Anisakis simplex TaxID=6269 RepID=A0A0M3JYM2_ANISI|nr:unnamed protein product [Anisakis simplex]